MGSGGAGLWVAFLWVLGSHSLLVQGDRAGLQLFEGIRLFSNEIALDLVLQTIVEGRDDDGGVPKLGLQHHLLEMLSISADRADLLESGKESLLGLLLGIQVSPLVLEVLLELLPVEQVVGALGSVISAL